jgi:hypothetical protein
MDLPPTRASSSGLGRQPVRLQGHWLTIMRILWLLLLVLNLVWFGPALARQIPAT